MSTQDTDSTIVVGESSKGWSYRLRGWRKFALLLVVLALAAGACYWWLQSHEATTPKAAETKTALTPNTKVAEPTAQQKHIITETTRGEGTISAVTANSVTFTLNDRSAPLTLKTDAKTLYSAGSNGFPAERTTLKRGQKAVVAYDKETNLVLSVWVDYDTQ